MISELVKDRGEKRTIRARCSDGMAKGGRGVRGPQARPDVSDNGAPVPEMFRARFPVSAEGAGVEMAGTKGERWPRRTQGSCSDMQGGRYGSIRERRPLVSF